MKNKAEKYGFRLKQMFIFLGSFLIISSCGGGGGGGGQPAGVVYDGLTSQASITAANANKIFSILWNGGPSSGPSSPSPAISNSAPSGYVHDGTMAALIKRLTGRTLSDLTDFAKGSQSIRRAPTPVHDTIYGSVSGTETVNGTLDSNTGLGTLTFTYENYNDGDGYTYDGAVTAQVNAFDLTYFTITDATLSFSLWTIKSNGVDVSLSGSMRMQMNLQTNSETLTVNMDGRDNMMEETFRFQNFVVTEVYNNILYPSSETESFSGRVYAAPYGYVDVSTVSPFVYSFYPQTNPDSGGPVALAGAGGSMAAVTPLSTSSVQIEVDADGDAVFETQNAYAWTNLAGDPVVIAAVAMP
jgi:chloramphenicol 3-O-phosphotransferase